ncbi:MAG: hypothetical protein SGILL_008419, partial [Bacillariaceae sp.]
ANTASVGSKDDKSRIEGDDPVTCTDESKKPRLKSTSKNKFEKRRSSSSPPKAYSLNSELHSLRKTPNGIPLAEQRLDTAIQEMLQAKDKDTISSDETTTTNDQAYPDETSFNSIISSYAKNANKNRFAASKAEVLLRKMKDLSGTFPSLRPTTFTYNAVMEAYSRQRANRQKNSDSIQRLYKELQEDGLTPNTYTWNLLVACIPQSSEEWKAIESWARDYLRNSSADSKKDDDDDNNIQIQALVPDRKTYNTLFKLYSESGDFKKAEELLRDLLGWIQDKDPSEYDNNNEYSSLMKPSKVWYHSILKALAVAQRRNGENQDENAAKILEEMTQLSSQTDDEWMKALQPDTYTFNNVLNVYALSGSVAPALALLEDMEKLYDSDQAQNAHCKPDCFSYTTVTKAFATKQQKLGANADTDDLLDLAEHAAEILDRMKSRRVTPNLITYNTLMNIWANVKTRDAMQIAEELLRAAQQPDSFSYSTMIHGWSKTRVPEAGQRAHGFFNELLDLPPSRQRRNFSITTLGNSVISTYAKSGEWDAPKHAEQVLAQLEGRFLNGDNNARPDKTTFLSTLNAYAKAGLPDAEERCDAMLGRMEHYREIFQLDGLDPDRNVYNAYLNALAKSQRPSAVDKAEEILTMMETSRNPDLRPDIVTYSTFIDCHTKCGERSLERAEELLRFVEGTYRRGDATLTPNAVFYSAILQAWAKTGTIRGAEKAEELLRRNAALFEEGNLYAKPTVIVYNAVIDSFARSGVERAAIQAEELLEELESLYQAGDLDMKPTRRTFNAVILAHRKDGNASAKAEELLHRMEELADGGRHEVRPDVVSYNTVIGAIVEDSSIADSSADRAQALLDRMEDLGIRPDGRTYGSVIEAWLRRNDEKGNALAEAMFAQFQDIVDRKKAKKKHSKDYLHEDAVWDVINAYRKNPPSDVLSSFLDYS